MSDRRATLSLEELQTACSLLERACLNDQRLVEAEIDARRPGSLAVADTGCPSWLEYHSWLAHKHAGGGPAKASDATVPVAESLSPAQALQQMLSNEPVRVTLELDSKSEEPQHPDGKVVNVYPKSPAALRWLDSLDGQCRRLAYAARQASALETISDDKLLALVPLGLTLAERLWVWILVHPGAFLPFDPAAHGNLEAPEWTAYLTPADYVALFAAHREVNDARIRLVNRAYGGNQDGAETIVPLDGLLAAFTRETGGRPSDVLSAWTLGEILGQAVAESRLHRESMARADRKRGDAQH